MPFDSLALVQSLENASPTLARKMTMLTLGLISPFNAHLSAKLEEWSEKRVEIKLKCHRSVKNHVGSIHAGALFTLGETCAGLLIVRNFSFKDYRPLMSHVEVNYEKQSRETVFGVAEISSKTVADAKKKIKNNEIPFVDMKTTILNSSGTKMAEVKTTWQVKPWKEVRVKK